jgi:hypothetical protein
MIRVLSHRCTIAGTLPVRRAIVIACGRRARRERQPALPKHKSESSGAYRLQADTAAAASVTPARAVSRP